MKKLYFKVKIGFGANDFVLIDEEDYPKAIQAQATSKMTIFKTGESISGSNIMAVIPAYSKSLGYKIGYEIDNNEVPKELREKYEEFGKQINLKIRSGGVNLLS